MKVGVPLWPSIHTTQHHGAKVELCQKYELNMWSTNTKLQLQYPLTNKAKRCLNFEEKTVFISLLLGLLLGCLHFRLHPPNVERFCLTCQSSVHEDVLDVTNIQDK